MGSLRVPLRVSIQTECRTGGAGKVKKKKKKKEQEKTRR